LLVFHKFGETQIMKTMTCKQLGGACDVEFHASTFEEIAQLSKTHGMEMAQRGDADHIRAMQDIQDLMRNPEIMNAWLESVKREFEALP
jgi:hypothetical protein